MNTYILIARHLGTVSGEKIYHYNKLRYMLSLGWRVLFLSGKKEKTPFDGNKNYENLVFPALTYTPVCYSRREVIHTLDAVAAAVGPVEDGKTIIESDAVNRAVWGELIAKRLRAKHLVFLLQERHPYDEDTRAFLRFKYERHELAGILPESINLILADEEVERRDDTRIKACCQNAVEDCEDNISCRIPEGAALTFGSIGRLDKHCVPAILKGFQAYAARHPEERFNLVLIGGAAGRKKTRTISRELRGSKNLHVIITGYLYPIPATLLKRIDVFVSTAGSAVISYRFHRPTVVVHPYSGEPSAILGLEENDGKGMYATLAGTTVEDCIERAVSDADKIQYAYHFYEDYFENMNTEFARQLTIADAVGQREYYNENRLMAIRSSHIKGQRLHWIIGHTVGAAGLNKLVRTCKIVRGEGR